MVGIWTVFYSVLVNGAPFGFIKPFRGIRQGDLLSPYLFLLCTKGFSALLRYAAHHRDLHGVSCSHNGPSITHLLFVDDSLLFCNASLSKCHIIMEILQAYEVASGQKINSDKSSIFFNSNTPHSLREEIKRFFNANSNVPLEKYLGLPPIIGKGKKQAFEDIKSKVQSKLKGWKGKLLSQAGREVLIKSVAQAIPVYATNCFLLPFRLCDDINSMMGKFWWGQKNEETKLRWLSWKHMCLAKKDGGMGFQDLKCFNLTLLAKQCWWLLHNGVVGGLVMVPWSTSGLRSGCHLKLIKESFLLIQFYHLKQELQTSWSSHHFNLDGKPCSLILYFILLKP